MQQISLESIYNEIKIVKREVELIRSALIPEEDISNEERVELQEIREQMARGEKHRLDNVLAELNV